MPGIVIAGAVLLALWALRQAGRMTPQQSRRFARQLGGYGLVGLAAIMGLRGNFIVAVPAFTFGAGLLGFNSFTTQQRGQDAPQTPNLQMDKRQAYKILGLEVGASTDEIRNAHKRLQRATHPDAGGSTYLAAQINAARDLLLKS